MTGLVAGFFTNADATYYSAPQALSGGFVQGHTHVTVQDLGNDLNPSQPPDPTKFAFFKGINDPGNGQGLLTATVTGGLPKGNYRVCTLASAENHQPVLMPVAQRGSADDCTKFVVDGDGTTINVAANDGSSGLAAAALAASAVAAGPDVAESTSASAAAATSSSSNDGSGSSSTGSSNNKGGKGSKDVNHGKGSSGNTSSSATETDCTAPGTVTATVTTRSTSAASVQTSCPADVTSTVTSTVTVTQDAGSAAATSGVSNVDSSSSSSASSSASSGSALGGIQAPPVTNSGNPSRPFEVNGNTFVNKSAAVQRACDIQFNACADAVNGGKLSGVTISQCSSQQQTCQSAA